MKHLTDRDDAKSEAGDALEMNDGKSFNCNFFQDIINLFFWNRYNTFISIRIDCSNSLYCELYYY